LRCRFDPGAQALRKLRRQHGDAGLLQQVPDAGFVLVHAAET
jgi:hypothetical protein